MSAYGYQNLNIGLPEIPLWAGVYSEKLDQGEINVLLNEKWRRDH